MFVCAAECLQKAGGIVVAKPSGCHEFAGSIWSRSLRFDAKAQLSPKTELLATVRWQPLRHIHAAVHVQRFAGDVGRRW